MANCSSAARRTRFFGSLGGPSGTHQIPTGQMAFHEENDVSLLKPTDKEKRKDPNPRKGWGTGGETAVIHIMKCAECGKVPFTPKICVCEQVGHISCLECGISFEGCRYRLLDGSRCRRHVVVMTAPALFTDLIKQSVWINYKGQRVENPIPRRFREKIVEKETKLVDGKACRTSEPQPEMMESKKVAARDIHVSVTIRGENKIEGASKLDADKENPKEDCPKLDIDMNLHMDDVPKIGTSADLPKDETLKADTRTEKRKSKSKRKNKLRNAKTQMDQAKIDVPKFETHMNQPKIDVPNVDIRMEKHDDLSKFDTVTETPKLKGRGNDSLPNVNLRMEKPDDNISNFVAVLETPKLKWRRKYPLPKLENMEKTQDNFRPALETQIIQPNIEDSRLTEFPDRETLSEETTVEET